MSDDDWITEEMDDYFLGTPQELGCVIEVVAIATG